MFMIFGEAIRDISIQPDIGQIVLRFTYSLSLKNLVQV